MAIPTANLISPYQFRGRCASCPPRAGYFWAGDLCVDQYGWLWQTSTAGLTEQGQCTWAIVGRDPQNGYCQPPRVDLNPPPFAGAVFGYDY